MSRIRQHDRKTYKNAEHSIPYLLLYKHVRISARFNIAQIPQNALLLWRFEPDKNDISLL